MIASLQNPLVKHLVKLREDKKYREKAGTILVSGLTLVREIGLTLAPIRIFAEKQLPDYPPCEWIQVSEAVLKKITGLPSPEPIAAEFPLPKPSDLANLSSLLALDSIRDPGNLGTLIRTALALGWGVYLLPSCADLFHEKVIRSSRAAAFRLSWKIGSWEELHALKERQHYFVYVADLEGKEIASLVPQKKRLLLLSNESKGVSAPGQLLGEKITIPMRGQMESLNVAVAGGILMYFLNQ